MPSTIYTQVTPLVRFKLGFHEPVHTTGEVQIRVSCSSVLVGDFVSEVDRVGV
jgi:hypothetical protein